MTRRWHWLVVLLLGGLAQAAGALEFGVLAVRPKELVAAQYQPLADYLSVALGGEPVNLRVLDRDELQDAIMRNGLDLVLTNPTSYLQLRSRNSLSGVLATVRTQYQGRATTQQGGVIITRAERTDIARLTDLRGHSVAVPSLHAMSGYLAPAFELREAGLRVPPPGDDPELGSSAKRPGRAADVVVQPVGTYDEVVRAVLDGRVDAGFVRSGVVEAMAAEGRLDPARLRIINRQALADFPFPVSTRLYPDWPLVALPQLDDDTVRRITAAVLALTGDHPAARAAGIAGFAPPADYLPVENLARALRLPPYDQSDPIRWADVWQRYWAVMVGVALAATLLVVLLLLLISRNRALRRSQAALTAAVAEQRALLNAMPFPVFEMDADGLLGRVWARSDRDTRDQTANIDPHTVLGRRASELFAPHVAERVLAAQRKAARLGLTRDVQVQLRGPAGLRDIELSISAIGGDAATRFLVLARDITVERESQRWLQIAASVFMHAGEGIVISDPDNRILDVNRALKRIIGYPDDVDLVGKPTQELPVHLPAGTSYATLQQALREHGRWIGEVSGRRPTGETYAATLHINAVRDESGTVTHHVGVLTDITLLKQQQARLEHMAYHDPLTGLPNRALLTDRLQLAMARSDRHGHRLAVAYIDLDGFKAINDTHGHAIGDRLLVAIAARMTTIIRDEDTLARLGGDEFVAVLGDLDAYDECLPIIERLLMAASAPVVIDDATLQVTASVGVALYPRSQASSADQLLRQADHAMYEAKLSGKNRYRMYGDAAQQAVTGR
jgi:diguanylate cyclase (GGDEF)-like protein/PAS domain S-box-containing protein